MKKILLNYFVGPNTFILFAGDSVFLLLPFWGYCFRNELETEFEVHQLAKKIKSVSWIGARVDWDIAWQFNENNFFMKQVSWLI
jgi:hypothetical protein